MKTTRVTILPVLNNLDLLTAAYRLRPHGGIPTYWPETAIGSQRPMHPAFHGDRADDLIAESAETPALIVTHSEVIVLRIRRRVAEGSLRPDEVAIYWIDGATERRIELDGHGDVSWWPPGVFSEDFAEVNAIWLASSGPVETCRLDAGTSQRENDAEE